jgi:hypothetical protein
MQQPLLLSSSCRNTSHLDDPAIAKQHSIGSNMATAAARCCLSVHSLLEDLGACVTSAMPRVLPCHMG